MCQYSLTAYLFTQNAARNAGGRLSTSPYDFSIAVITRVPPSRFNTGGFIDIFSPLVWILLAVSILILTQLRFWVDAERNPDLYDRNKWRQFFNCLISTLSIFAQQEVHPALTTSGHFLVGTSVPFLIFLFIWYIPEMDASKLHRSSLGRFTSVY